MDLRQLTTFVAVADEASFSRAADRLHVVQSAVSATIRTLEREWGVTLFDRSTHAVALSHAGAALLPEARAALRAADAVRFAAEEVRGGLRGTVRVGIMQAHQRPGGISVARALAAFGERHPEVAVEVEQGANTVLAEQVRSGAIDVAFVGLPEDALTGLDVRPLVVVEHELVCAPAHRLAGRASVTLRGLAGEPFADGPPAWGVRIATDRAFAAAGVQRRVAYEINDQATIVDFVRHGLAVALLPRVSVAADDVAFVPVRRGAPRLAIALVTLPGRQVSPAARAFADLARTAALT